jgi:hypothetical protein
MNNNLGGYSVVPGSSPLSWSQTWLNALLRPSVKTYEDIIADPQASTNRAYIWVFISALLGYGISTLVQAGFAALRGGGVPATGEVSGVFGSPLPSLVCGVPLFALLSVFGLIISAGISHFVAAGLGGTGTYSKLAYALAAYLAPLTLISGVIAGIPIPNCLNFPLGIYGIVLNVIAVKAVHQFSWGKALAASILVFAGILLVVAVFVIVILALLGPAIGNVFSNIVENMVTPIP